MATMFEWHNAVMMVSLSIVVYYYIIINGIWLRFYHVAIGTLLQH